MEIKDFEGTYYRDRKVLLTGATGFLGTALLAKLILTTDCKQVIALVRGGATRLWSHLESTLPTPAFIALRKSERIYAIDSDLTKENFGITSGSLSTLLEASVFIHTASSINLAHPLARIAKSVVYPSIDLVKLALGSPNLERFVYISTAYANAHLHHLHDLVETEVEEELYPLGYGETEQELKELQSTGSTTAFEQSNFPFPYSYAKHLTERLITAAFQEAGRKDDLLIIRPSVIGPALAEPYPYYESLGSVPATGLLAAAVLCRSMTITWSSAFDDPVTQSTIDEVPVDIVVNQIIVHTAARSHGCVHAVAGLRGRRTFGDLWENAMRLRVLPWEPTVVWKSVDWASDELHPIARFFRIFGTSYLFDQSKTDAVWENAMSKADRVTYPLYLRSCKDLEDLGQRGKAVEEQIRWFLNRCQIPQWLASYLVKDLRQSHAGNSQAVWWTAIKHSLLQALCVQ